MVQTVKKFDLEERTARFGEDVIKLCRVLRPDPITRPLISQLVRSATSIGANYMEANGASSKKDFRNKIFICKKKRKKVSIGYACSALQLQKENLTYVYYGRSAMNWF